VDLAGLPVDRDRLYEIADRRNLRVIEDAAQALGASWKGQAIGSAFGAGRGFVSFSFHANKNLTTSEGGALVLPADIDVPLCERLRLQGVKRFPDGGMDVDVLGGKFNLTDIAAAIGLGQLPHCPNWLTIRLHCARRNANWPIRGDAYLRCALYHSLGFAIPNAEDIGLDLPPAMISAKALQLAHVPAELLPPGLLARRGTRPGFIAHLRP
jgi:hypothetical protein